MIVAPQANPKLLHLSLALGMTGIAAVFAGMILLGTGPLLPADNESEQTIAWALAGVAIVLIAVAMLVLRPRVPRPQPGQTPAMFWSKRATAEAAYLVWFALEGACSLASIGFFLTGDPFLGVIVGAGVILLWLNGPGRFERAI